jgi:hypothetical protein
LGNPVGNIDSGGTWGSYIGLVFLAGGYVAIGSDLLELKQFISPDGVSWTGSVIWFSRSSTIFKTSLKVDKIIDNTQTPGVPGQVLTVGPVGQEILWANINLEYYPAYPSYWESPAPTTVQQALDRISKYIYTTSSAVIPW